MTDEPYTESEIEAGNDAYDESVGAVASAAQPLRHQVELVKAWRCVDCGELFYPDWPLDEVPCPAHERTGQ